MKTAHNTHAPHGITRREGLLTLLGSAMALAGCGGGGGDGGGVASVGGGGTGSLSVGPISGIGSIICNGVRFEDSLARVLDDDGALHDRKELKLGMMVRVKGKPNSRKADKTDAADEISFGSELLGPIDSIQNAQTIAATLVVLGQTVQITATTVFEEGLTLTGPLPMAVGNIVEVHGFVDPVNNHLVATRIERKLLADVKAFKLQGRISTLSATTFQIGTLIISFASAGISAGLTLANDLLVRVQMASTTTTTGTRTAVRIRKVEAETEDRDEAEAKGTITDFTSTAKFSVNGLQIDASGVTVPANLKKGDRVEVEGRLVKGVLVAKKVGLEDEKDPFKFELHGTVSGKTATSLTFTFTLTSSGGIVAKVTVTIADVVFVNGITAASLSNGVKLEVKGVASPDGTIKATRISLE